MAPANVPDLWYRCTTAGARPVTIDEQVVLLWLCLTLLGCAFGFALCRFVQSIVPLRARKELMNFAQIGGMVAWVTPLLVCSPWSFFLMLMAVYMFGCEPFDNVLWPPMWEMVRDQWALGRKVYAYWAVSSLVVHFWFVGGAAGIVIGIDYPRWFWIAIYGFGASHTARMCAFHHLDRWAGWLEAAGILLLVVCVVLSFVEDNMLPQRVWLSVATAERLTHLPGALRGQVGWMRSYELWEEVFPDDPTYAGLPGEGYRRKTVALVTVGVDAAEEMSMGMQGRAVTAFSIATASPEPPRTVGGSHPDLVSFTTMTEQHQATTRSPPPRITQLAADNAEAASVFEYEPSARRPKPTGPRRETLDSMRGELLDESAMDADPRIVEDSQGRAQRVGFTGGVFHQAAALAPPPQ